MSLVLLTAAMVAEATGARLVAGAADRVFDDVSTDSRAMAPGALFIALRGDRFDGHAFVSDALRRGAAGVLVDGPVDVTGDVVVLHAADTLAALQALARAIRRASGARVVAITGSAGKTTTKEVTADVLATRYRVFRNRGNLNNHIGLPLSLIELRRGADLAVVELGMNHAGEIRTLVGIAEPDVRVWINVGDAHLGHFASREALADAKAEILAHAGPETLLVANADDTRVMARTQGFAGRTVTFGEASTADVRASTVVDRGFDGASADVRTREGTLHLTTALPGRAQVHNVLAAVAVAIELGVPPAAIEQAVAAIEPVGRRGVVTTLANGTRLVDDSYNASPSALGAMLQALAATATRGRRIAVIGEMLELGEGSHDLHASCGRAAAEAGVDELVVIGGPAADGLVEGARAAGLPAARIHRFADSASAAALVASLVGADDLVLVKGSRGTRTDLVSDRLREVA
jgi:UDP-N-acetylmuramoyl-tripeptide--D-alanyl-D-alanine ligase